MIRRCTWATPDGRKVSIMPEEIGLGHDISPVGLRAGEPFGLEFRPCTRLTLARRRCYGLWSKTNK
jgi:hypothetical protein